MGVWLGGGSQWAPVLSAASQGSHEWQPVHPWGLAPSIPSSSWLPRRRAWPRSVAPLARRGQSPLPSTVTPQLLHAQETAEDPAALALGARTGCTGSSSRRSWGAQSTAGTGCISKAAERLICKINAAKKNNPPISGLSCGSSRPQLGRKPQHEVCSALGRHRSLYESCQHPRTTGPQVPKSTLCNTALYSVSDPKPA